MQTFQQLFSQLLKDIRIELNEEFDRNFERKAFFNTAWKQNRRGTPILIASGMLRKSLRSQIIGNSIRWESSIEYADIHNEGGTITVTPKMKGFFRYKMVINYAKGSKVQSPEYQLWLSLAKKPVGSQIVMPKRQFIGDHPVVHQCVKDVTDEWFQNDVKNFIDNQLNNMIR